MTAGMAAMVPGGCQQVSDDQCGTVPDTGTGGSPWTPAPPPTNSFDGLTQIELTVMEGTDMAPMSGVNVNVVSVDRRDGSTGPGGSGTTDVEGKFYFEGMAPSPNTLYMWRMTVSPTADTPSFPIKELEVPARTAVEANKATGQPQLFTPKMTICATGTDSLVCDVANAQMTFMAVYNQQLEAWNYESSGRPPQIATFAADQAHAAVRFSDPRLQRNWETFSWWVGDLAIPPSDWPDLVEWVEQTGRIFNNIPFPEIGDYFVRCARGIPIYKGMSIANPRLYSKTFSDYFPRHDYQIEVDMAVQYTMNLAAIMQCIEHKIKKKIREIERSAKAWRMMGLVSTFLMAPLAGSASMTLLTTSVASYAYETLTGGDVIPDDVETLVTSSVAVISENVGLLQQAIAVGVDLMIRNFAEDLDPVVQQIAVGAASQLASYALEDVVSGVVTTGASDFVSLSSVSSAVAAFAIKIIAKMITAEGIKGVEGLKNTLLGFDTLDDQMKPYIVWSFNTQLLGALFDAAAQMASDQQENGDVTPSDGAPVDGVPVDGVPVDGVPVDGVPVDGVPVDGVPVDGVPVDGVPVDGVPVDGVPVDGVPVDVPIDDIPVDGIPPAGVTIPPDQGPPLSDFDSQTDIVDPLLDQAADAGISFPSSITQPAVPIIDQGSKEAGDIAAITAVGAGGLIVALVGAGVFGS